MLTDLPGLTIATTGILIRSCFRAAELSEGFDGALANDENTIMVLEGAMVAISTLALTLLHPVPAFRCAWKGANFKLRKRVGAKSDGDSGIKLDLTA